VLALIGFICLAIGVKLLESHLNIAQRTKAEEEQEKSFNQLKEKLKEKNDGLKL